MLSLGRASASGPISEVLYIRTEWPRSIYQYSNMALRLSGQTSIFGVVLYSSLLGIQQPRSQGPVERARRVGGKRRDAGNEVRRNFKNLQF